MVRVKKGANHLINNTRCGHGKCDVTSASFQHSFELS